MIPRSRWLLGCLLGLCLVTRLAFALRIPADEIFYPDGFDYSRVALAIVGGQGFYPPDLKPHIVYRAPLYPFLLAGIYGVAGESNYPAVRLFNCLLALATGWLIFSIGRRLGGELAGLLALGAFAVHPFFIYQVATVSPETPFIFLALLTYFFLFRVFDRRRLGDTAFAGVALGLAALTKGTILLLLPAACLTILFALRLAWRQGLALSAVLATVALLTISPISLWAYARWHEFSLILDGSGLNFYIANSEHSVRLFSAQTPEEFRGIQEHLWMDVLPAYEREIGSSSPAARDAYYFAKGRHDFASHPGTSLWMMYERFKIFWRPWVHPMVYGFKEVLVSGASTVPLFLFGFAGLVQRVKSVRPDAVFFAMALIPITLVTGMLFNTEIRWRLPLVDSMLIVYSALFLAPLVERWLPARWTPLAAPEHPGARVMS